MRRALFALASITSLGLAAPTLTLLGWSSQLAEFYSLVDKHAQLARDLPDFPNPPSCDLTQASQPVAPTPLPSPDPSLVLKEVVIGRGVQVSRPHTSNIWRASLTSTPELYLLQQRSVDHTGLHRRCCLPV